MAVALAAMAMAMAVAVAVAVAVAAVAVAMAMAMAVAVAVAVAAVAIVIVRSDGVERAMRCTDRWPCARACRMGHRGGGGATPHRATPRAHDRSRARSIRPIFSTNDET